MDFPSLSLPSLGVRLESQHQNGRMFRREWDKSNPLWVGIEEWAVLSRSVLRSLQPSLTMFLMLSCMSLTNFPREKEKGKKTPCFKELFLSFLTVLLSGKVVKTWWCSNTVLQSGLLLNWFFTWLQVTAPGMIVERSYTCSCTNRCTKNETPSDCYCCHRQGAKAGFY